MAEPSRQMNSKSAKDRLALRLLIDDKEFRAIGHVAAQWAFFENQLDQTLSILIQQPTTKDLGLTMQQSFMRRMRTLREAAKVVLAGYEPSLSEILEISNEASSLRGLRDDIIHGHWKIVEIRDDGARIPGVKVISQGPKLKVREIKFPAEKVEEVAARISRVNLRLIYWIQRNVPWQ
jgi:hypothetical protein